MAANSYSLRSRFNSPVSVKTSTNSPLNRTPISSPRKPNSSISLRLEHVIGTTTTTPSGLACCSLNNSYAYCGGSVATVASINADGSISYRYYKARPTASAVNPTSSYYDKSSATPTKKRSSILPKRRDTDTFETLNRQWQEDGGSTWTARERIKTVTCVSLSPDGSLLAVGETGYNPRVLIFSTATDASVELPLSIITEHTFGVRCCAFSSDSKWLATLGDVNDGFLFLWSVNTKTGSIRLYAANKCTTNICHMAWCGKVLITVGTRHVKLWHIPTSEASTPSTRTRLRSLVEASSTASPQPLSGRNCLLGRLVGSTFKCVVSITDSQAVVCSDLGEVCLIDTSRTPSELQPLNIGRGPIQSLDYLSHTRKLIWADGRGLHETDIESLLENEKDRKELPSSLSEEGQRLVRRSGLRESLGLDQRHFPGVLALRCLIKHTICIDSESTLSVTNADCANENSDLTASSSHHGAVKGVRSLPRNTNFGNFFTWTKSGEVRFWKETGELLRTVQVDLDDFDSEDGPTTNELSVLRHLHDNKFIAGDRFGALKCLEGTELDTRQVLRAHGAEINDISLHKGSSIVATCGRDRMVQIFQMQADGLELLQTSDDHISAVNQVLFTAEGERLLSCSSDRTIVVREKVQRQQNSETKTIFLQTKVITMKASPLSMSLTPGNTSNILVSTMDRHISKLDYLDGSLVSTFKVSDPETDESVVLSSIHACTLDIGTRRANLLTGYSPTDKSVRTYDFDKGVLLGRESAHTEGVSDLELLFDYDEQDQSNSRKIISTGQDSTIMIWTIEASSQSLVTPLTELSQEQSMVSCGLDATPAKPTPASLPPMRKILSKIDLAEFGATPPRSPSRDTSPVRLARKTSKLALAASAIDEGDENQITGRIQRPSADEKPQVERKSLSPTRQSMSMPRKQRSRANMSEDWLRRSPSPPPLSAPSTPKTEQRADRLRLRRPPSVPVDLRGQVLNQHNRRQSVSILNDFGSMGMASEQACRMLRTYRGKLEISKEDLSLEEIEKELEAVLRVVRRKRQKLNGASGNDGSRDDMNMDFYENEEFTIVNMLERTSLRE